MKNKPEPADSSLSETTAARIEIKELGDPAHQKKITDAVEALDGVIETKIEKSALHVSYVRWQRLKRKSSRLSVLPGVLSKPQPQIQKQRILICQRPQAWNKLPLKMRTTATNPE